MERHRRVFEFNDLPWVPAVLRGTIVDALGRPLRWGHLLEGAGPALADCMRRAGTTDLVDLCSGSGEATLQLVSAARRSGAPAPRLTLTDLRPRVERWPENVQRIETPIDVTRIPPALIEGRVVTICNSFHHFRPTMAASVLRQLCASARGVFIVELLNPSPWSFAAMAPLGLVALLATPALAQRRSLRQMALTWASPVALAMSAWDGVASALRTYRADELHAFAAPIEGWRWQAGTFSHSAGRGHGSWFMGTLAP